MSNINVYADKVIVEGENVYLERVDPSQVVQEFGVREVLESLEFSDIVAYVAERQAEDEPDGN